MKKISGLLVLCVVLAGCKSAPVNVPEDNPNLTDLIDYRNGLGLLREGRAEEALQLLQRARQAYPKNPAVVNALGLALLYKKDYVRALKAFDEALFFDRKFVEAQSNRGVTLMELDRLDEAEKDFNSILDGPEPREKVNAHFNMGVLMGKRERWTDAEREFSFVITEDPSYVRAFRERGLVRMKREDFRGALDDLLRFLRNEPKDPASLYNSALCLLTTGRRDVAVRYMERTVKLAPDTEEAKKAKRFLEGESLILKSPAERVQ